MTSKTPNFTYFANKTNFNNNQNISCTMPHRFPAEFSLIYSAVQKCSLLGPELRSDRIT